MARQMLTKLEKQKLKTKKILKADPEIILTK